MSASASQSIATEAVSLPIEDGDTPIAAQPAQEEHHIRLAPVIPVADIVEAKRGVFLGVLVPNCEFQWSVIIFIRFGVIVGEAGVLLGLGLIVICAACVLLTHCAISAAASNEIPKGGVTSILTKSLGTGIGGAITILYVRNNFSGIPNAFKKFFGVAVFQTIEIYGSAEGLLKAFSASVVSNMILDRAIIAGALLCLILIPVLMGPRVVHRLAAIFMICLGLSFLSVLIGLDIAKEEHNPIGDITGVRGDTLRANLFPSETFDMREALSLLVPCFVGMFVGTNNASELKDPLRDIPRGGFMAVSISIILYSVLFVLIGSVAVRERLVRDTLVLTNIAWPSRILSVLGIVLVGVGSSMQSLIIASKVLRSLSELDIFTNLGFFGYRFERGSLSHTSAADELETSFLSTLDIFTAWARVMHLYHGYSELDCDIERNLRFFRLDSEHITLGAGIQSVLYYIAVNHLHRREREDYQQQVKALIALRDAVDSISPNLRPLGLSRQKSRQLLTTSPLDRIPVAFKVEKFLRSHHIGENTWRGPQVLAFVAFGGDGTAEGLIMPERRASALVAFVGQIRSGSFRGGTLCILANVITEQEEMRATSILTDENAERSVSKESVVKELLLRRKLLLQDILDEENVFGFAKVIRSPTAKMGESLILQAVGLGDFTPNTICALWPPPDVTDRELQFLTIRWTSLIMGQNPVFLKIDCANEYPSGTVKCGGSIDIWWLFRDGEIMLLLGYLLQQSSTWKNTSLRLFLVSRSRDETPFIKSEIALKLKLLRVKVQSIHVIDLQV
ncbi:hypothetical protein HDU97_001080 [Phlyctochytrium planicorne]|nr:hypothetical protein HDU97_001080 [Phlyctochytrium planicorne]